MTMNRKPSTLAIHGNEIENGRSDAVSTPIYHTSTYHFPNSQAVEDYIVGGKRDHYCYARYGNPAQTKLQERLALLEGGEDCLFFASGMAAITTAIMAVVEPGDEIIAIPALYGQSLNFLTEDLKKYNVSSTLVSNEELYDIEKIKTSKTKLIYLESPTNPNLQILDIKRITDQAKAFGITTMIDNTFASPINQRPLSLGCDIVVHSATKYLGGHSDVLAGAVVGTKELIEKCYNSTKIFGPIIDPFNVFLLLRSLPTLELRVKRQNESALIVAKELKKHKNVISVKYPGLPDDPDFEVAAKQMTGFGGMVNIDVKGGKAAAMKTADNLEVVLNAVSLGGVESLISLPVITSHPRLNDEELKRAGITKGMIRISVGLEDPEDIAKDFIQSLDKL